MLYSHLIPYHNMLTPVLAFFSSPKDLVGLFGRFCVGAQVTVSRVLFGLSVPKNSFRATPTTGHVLLPTKCVPSSGTAPFPYVAAIGYAAIVLASLFCILRAKGFSYCLSSHRNHRDPPPMQSAPKPRLSHSSVRSGAGPPSPPLDPGSSCITPKAPRWNPWLWFLLFVLFLLALSAVMDAYIYCTIHVSTGDSQAAADGLTSFFAPSMSLLEGCLSNGWRRISGPNLHLALHGRQYLKIVLIALSSHFVCIIAASAFRRVCTHAISFAELCWFPICSFLVCIVVISSFAWSSWMFWAVYYFGCWYKNLLTVREIHENMIQFSSWATSCLVKVPTMFIGVVIVHLSLLCIWTTFFVLFRLLFTARTVIRMLSRPHCLREFLLFCFAAKALFFTDVMVGFPILQYRLLSSEAKQLLWDAFSSKESRDTALSILWYLLRRYQDWKSEQIQDFHKLTAGLSTTFMATPRSCWEMWSTVPMSQKFLIAAPTIVFYGYFHIIPAGKRLPFPVRNWRRR
ncbi:hypothetical protein B0H11DRAFT_1951577, partial [Mycena galericulata]